MRQGRVDAVGGRVGHAVGEQPVVDTCHGQLLFQPAAVAAFDHERVSDQQWPLEAQFRHAGGQLLARTRPHPQDPGQVYSGRLGRAR